MNLPTYLPSNANENLAADNYQQELNQTLRENLGPNGWSVTNITANDLTTTQILDPNSGLLTTIKDLMPVGTIWSVVDAYAPNTTTCTWVAKKSSGPTVLVQFSAAPWP
jgi:hypothetical protein